jgi:ribonuclease HI
MRTYVLHFDGSCWPNPGGRCGYGWHVDFIDDGDDPTRLAEGRGEIVAEPRTNNVAELTGALRGLEWFACLATVKPDDRLHAYGDSEFAVNFIRGTYGSKKPHLAPLVARCRELLKSIRCPSRVEWVVREKNAEADRLASVDLTTDAPKPTAAPAGAAVTLTRELIHAGRGDDGGWTREQLALLGVPWPPKRGWVRAAAGNAIEPAVYETFLKLGREV